MHRLLVLASLLAALPASAVTIEWVYVGNPGNPADTVSNCYAANCGSVAYDYYISKYEVTNAQYAEFLNAKAASDPLALYNTSMGSEANYGGITRSGVSGSYTYAAKAGFTNRPVTYATFYDALRFSNWLQNGQGSGDTETGAYTLLGGTAAPSNGLTVTRNPGAIAFLTSENEWYKAAYYSPGGVYFDYQSGTDTVTSCSTPTAAANRANCDVVFGYAIDVGSYTGSASPYGTFDQGGNVYEWYEEIIGGSARGVRGGGWYCCAGNLAASNPSNVEPTYESPNVGFRVASRVPEPACDDGIDNDGDNLIDYPADPGCGSPSDAIENPQCEDGIDNDGDGLKDALDPGCGGQGWRTTENPACADGIDNDGDVYADYVPGNPAGDFGCHDATDQSEGPDCSDGIDNDGDGLLDYPADPGCQTDLEWAIENPGCSDGADNDRDGKIDFVAPTGSLQDPQCVSAWDPVEAPHHCGLGAELVVPLGALLLAPRRAKSAGRLRGIARVVGD